MRGGADKIVLGNLDAFRDWGHAKDYVEGMWLMLQQPTPDDFILSTGEQHSVREFIELAFAHVGKTIRWVGTGPDEKGLDAAGNVLVEVSPAYYRPTEVDSLLGDCSKAKTVLSWTHKISFKDLVKEMVDSDMLSKA
jgi:GDPmannose 4,6-dehydratase